MLDHLVQLEDVHYGGVQGEAKARREDVLEHHNFINLRVGRDLTCRGTRAASVASTCLVVDRIRMGHLGRPAAGAGLLPQRCTPCTPDVGPSRAAGPQRLNPGL